MQIRRLIIGPVSGDLVQNQRVATKEDYIYIPLKDPSPPASAAKPPLPRAPPRVVGASVKGAHHRTHDQDHRRRRTIDSGECPRPMEPMGLIETDLDTQVTVITSGANNVKTRSLLNLGAEPRLGHLLADDRQTEQTARPHKSMEFLLDKQNLKVVEVFFFIYVYVVFGVTSFILIALVGRFGVAEA